MKVAQNDEKNPDTQPVRPPRLPNIANTQLSPSGSSVRKRETPGILSRMFPPFVDITYHYVRSPLAPPLAASGFVLHLIALARRRGRQLRSRTGQQQRRSRSLPEKERGKKQ